MATSSAAVFLQESQTQYDPQTHLLKLPHGNQYYIGQKTLRYAILLFERNQPGDHQRACDVVRAVLDVQLHSPDWEAGRFPMLHPETWRDLNANLFMTPDLITLHRHWRSAMPELLAADLDRAIHAAVNIVERRWADELFDPHRDFVGYSNIFALYVRALFMLGDALNIPRLTRDALYQWRRWFNRIAQVGMEEFTSNTYTHVICEALLDIHALVNLDASVRKEVALLLDHLLTLQHAVNHPILQVQAVGTSRDYRLFVQPGEGAFPYLDFEGSHGYTPSATIAQQWKQRQYPWRVTGRAGTTPFLFQSWQDRAACLGTMTGGNYFFQQIHLMAAVGSSPAERACAFINADPVNAINGFTHQQDHHALCLFARTPTTFAHYQQRKDTSRASLPLEGTLPACIGFTEGWSFAQDQPGVLVARAHGHQLVVRSWKLEQETLTPMTLTMEQVDVGRGNAVTGWRAPADVVYAVFDVQLLKEGQQAEAATLTCEHGIDRLHIASDAGLSLDLFRRPNGELIQRHAEDYRMLPLLETPEHTLHGGDLIARSLHA